MKLSHDKLTAHLAGTLAPVYLVTGDELLFVQEACSAIKNAARRAGFSELVRYSVDTSFDWSNFYTQLRSASLFGEKQCLELHFTTLRLSDTGKTVWLNGLQRLPADKIVLVVSGKLDATTQKSAWLKALDAVGVVVTVWPLAPAQWQPWLARRLQAAGFNAEADAVQWLAAQTQGNLLAAAQEVEKLSLLYPSGPLTLTQLRAASSDHARFDPFALVDAVVQGEGAQALRILSCLQQEGVEPILVLWALVRELRLLLRLKRLQQHGQSLEQALHSQGVWEKRKPLLKRALRQHPHEDSLRQCLLRAAQLDRIIKGMALGSVWNELQALCVHMSGRAYAPAC